MSDAGKRRAQSYKDRIQAIKDFERDYLAPLKEYADKLRTIASSATFTLSGAGFATEAFEKLEEAANQLLRVLESCEISLREERKRLEEAQLMSAVYAPPEFLFDRSRDNETDDQKDYPHNYE